MSRWIAGLRQFLRGGRRADGVREASERTRELWLRARGKWAGAEKWNTAYTQGRWDYLGRLDELAHYSILAGYAQWLKPGGSLLDVGCGVGLFRERLNPATFSRYTGIDFAEPIVRAGRLSDERTTFVEADMTTYQPAERFDVIVFSEVVPYFSDPLAGLARYAGFLEPNGVLLVSMFIKPTIEKLWRAIDETYAVLDEVTITNRAGASWLCKALVRHETGP